MNHPTINKAQLTTRFTGPDRSDQIAAALRDERSVLASAQAGSTTAMVATRNVETLRTALEHARQNDQAMAKLEKRIADETATDRTRSEERRAAQEAEVKARLRSRYLSMPGTSEEDFERDYPQLLSDHRRQQMAVPGVNKSRYAI